MSRQIEPKLVDFIRGKLSGVGAFALAVQAKDARGLYLLANQALVGIREKTGNNDGPLVELLQETIDGHDRESWCMSGQQSAIAFAEELTGIRSPVVASEGCLDVWNRTPVACRVKSIPLPGALTIWAHGQTGKGHTGCTGAFDSARGTFESYEGNTEAGEVGGKVVREGGGFYFVPARSAKEQGDMRVVGWLKPFAPADAPAPVVITGPGHTVKASSFADPADVKAFRACKARGGTDQHCFLLGDNGVGAWGHNCAQTEQPMAALPPEIWKAAGKRGGARLVVTYKGQRVEGILGDTMPELAHIKNGAGIDLNPAFAAAFGERPPFMLDGVVWDWV